MNRIQADLEPLGKGGALSRHGWILLWGPVAIWIGLILAATSIPGPALPESPFTNFDLLVHVAIYGGLGFWVYRAVYLGTALAGRHWASGLAAFVGAGMFGVLDEFHQYFIPGRFCAMSDMLADIVGAAVGCVGYRIWIGVLASSAVGFRTRRPKEIVG